MILRVLPLKKIIIVLIYCIFNVNTCLVGYFLCRKNNGYRSGTENILVDKSPIYLTFFKDFKILFLNKNLFDFVANN